MVKIRLSIFKALLPAVLVMVAFMASAQARYFSSAVVEEDETVAEVDTVGPGLVGDSIVIDTTIVLPRLPRYFFRPAVYDHYKFRDTVRLDEKFYTGKEYMKWIEDEEFVNRNMDNLRYNLFIGRPDLVKYNIDMLPEAPKVYHAVVNPEDHTITIEEVVKAPVGGTTLKPVEVKKRHWIRDFRTSLQFSQAYVSPNWYQGGNNNLNVLGQIYYNVKLNQEYHPNLLFETTAQYKLGLNSAPDDSLRNYSISEDLFQINTTLGIKAASRWYYSLTAQFKTQLLNSYKSNTHNLVSALLSPGDLTAGIGMTYNYVSPKKNFSFDASLAPLSYNMRTCINEEIDETAYGITEGRKTVHKFGSSAEFKLMWRMSSNIVFNSRLFAFSDYEVFRADWENTLMFEINRFLTTQIYAHLRYDTNGAVAEGTKWKKLQLKEILSIGFSYKFSSL